MEKFSLIVGLVFYLLKPVRQHFLIKSKTFNKAVRNQPSHIPLILWLILQINLIFISRNMHTFSIFQVDEETNLKQQYLIFLPTIFEALVVKNDENLLTLFNLLPSQTFCY